jgi:hypothetical protein
MYIHELIFQGNWIAGADGYVVLYVTFGAIGSVTPARVPAPVRSDAKPVQYAVFGKRAVTCQRTFRLGNPRHSEQAKHRELFGQLPVSGKRIGPGDAVVAAYSKPGGQRPLCYPSGVTAEMIAKYRERH